MEEDSAISERVQETSTLIGNLTQTVWNVLFHLVTSNCLTQVVTLDLANK